MVTKKQQEALDLATEMEKPIDKLLDDLWLKMRIYEKAAQQIHDKIVLIAPQSRELGLRFKYFKYVPESQIQDNDLIADQFELKGWKLPVIEKPNYAKAKKLCEKAGLPCTKTKKAYITKTDVEKIEAYEEKHKNAYGED